jgi:chlorophyll(ide) b reductase
MDKKLNVIVTGGSRGFGRSLVKQFVNKGHRVLYTSSSKSGHIDDIPNAKHIVMDVRISDPDRVYNTFDQFMPNGVDIWINNAAISDGNRKFLDTSSSRLKQIVDTNLYGTLISTKLAIDLMTPYRKGHIFNVIGAGAGGSITPDYAVYGSTKAGVTQFTRTLQKELAMESCPIGLHLLSPGMMATELLEENLCEQKRIIYNILCEYPDIVATEFVPKIVDIVQKNQKNQKLNYMTPSRILHYFLTASSRKDRFYR